MGGAKVFAGLQFARYMSFEDETPKDDSASAVHRGGEITIATRRATVTVHFDEGAPLKRVWRYVGYDEPNYTYTPAGRTLLGKLGGMADAPYFIRCHFLLCSGDGTGKLKWGSANVYSEEEEGEPVCEWRRNPLAVGAPDGPETPSDISGLAARDERGGVQILLVSHHDDWDVERETEVRLRVTGLEPGRKYELRRSQVDRVQANAHTAWQEMGRPQQPTPEQRAALQGASRLVTERVGTFQSDGDVWEMNLTLPSHAVWLLQVAPL